MKGRKSARMLPGKGKSACMTGRKNPSPNSPLVDSTNLRRRRRRSFEERNQETGYPSRRRLTERRVAIIKNFIRRTTEKSSTEDSGTFGSERWMDNLITLLDPKDSFDLLYNDIQLWLQTEPVFEETRRKALSKKKSNPPDSGTTSSTESERENNAVGVGGIESTGSSTPKISCCIGSRNSRVAGEILDVSESAMDLSTANVSSTKVKIPVAPDRCSTTQIPTQTNGGEEHEGEVLNPPVVPAPLSRVKRELPDDEGQESPEVTAEEAAMMRRTFYQAMKRKLDQMITMNLSIPPEDPSHISDEVLRPVIFMMKSLAKPGTSKDEIRAALFHASTFVTNQVVTSGPVVFGTGANQAAAPPAEDQL